MFPAIAMRLLDFVALYGMVLMPMGAIIFVDFWLSRRLGFEFDYAERAGITFNWAAAVTWLGTVVACVVMVQAGLQIYFVSLPGWFIAAAGYVVLSRVMQQPLPQLAASATLRRA